MKSRFFSVRDKLFMVLFSIGWFVITYATYKVIGAKTGEETLSLVNVIKSTISNVMS